MKKLLKPKEAAFILNVNYRKVLDLIASGEIQAYKVGNKYRISKISIFNYLENCKYQSAWIN